MDKREEVLQNKELNLKGIDTSESTEVKPSMNSTIPEEGKNPENSNEPVDPVDPNAGIDPLNPKHEKKSSSFLNWEDPKDEQESLEKGMSSSLGLTGGSSIAGDTGSFDTKQAQEAMAPINLGKYIPDPRERDKFLRDYGEKLIQLDHQTYGITFENDIRDLVEFKQKDYPKRMKRFLDDLDDSQGFLEEMHTISANFVGNTIVNTVGGVLNVAYGPLTALLTWDISKVYDNYLMDGVEWTQDWITKHTVIYGGSDMYNIDPKTGDFVQKEFLARFSSDPIKSLNQDLVPAAAFISGAILQEFAAGLVAVPTGGTSLALSTANIVSRGTNLYRRIFGTNKLYSTTMKAVRGLDDNLLQLGKLKNSAQFQKVQKTFGQIGNNVTGAYRSASFESAIIAREIQDTTYNNLLVEYHKNNGGEVDENGLPVGELIEPDSETLRRFEDLSKDAGNLGFAMNVPLVAGSRMVQFPRIFGRNMSSANISNKILGNYSGTGTRIVNGRRVANVDASKGLKAFGYTRDIISKPVAEGWEEFAQEAISGGLTSYYTSSYSKDSAATITGAIGGVVDQMSHVMDSAEGRDSVTIGALMGALGVWLPIKLNKTTGKPSFSLKGEVMGGIYGSFQDTKSRHDKAREAAGYMNENLNENNVNVPLSEYFNSYIKHSAAQREMDEAISKGDKMSYKNAEHKQLFSYVHSKVNQGVGDLVLEDIKKERELTLDEFNKKHAHEQDTKFTEETKKEAIDKAEARVSKMIKDINKVQTLVENNAHMGANKIAYWFRKKAGQDVHKPLTATELQNAKGLQEQVAYLYSSVENSKEREISLIDSIRNQTEGEFNFGLLDQIKATAKGIVPIKTKDSEGKEVVDYNVNFIDDHKEVVKLALNEWKKTDLESYNKYSESIKEDLADIVKLKIQRAKAAEMYKGMFTYKGAKAFRELSYELAEARAEEILKNYEEKIKEDAKNKKNAKLSSVKSNEASINNGQSPIVDAKEEDDIRKGLKELEGLNPEALSSEAYYQEVLDILDKYPGFMSFVHREGIKRGLPLENSYTGQEILALDAEDPSRTVEAGIMNIINDIKREFKDYESDPKNAPDFESENDYDQPSSDEIITDGTTEENTVDVEKVSVNSNNIIYVNVDHKQLEKLDNGKVVAIREEDGTFRNNPAVNNPDYKVDYEKVNSTGFLNNETLESENHEFEFRIPVDNTYNLTDSESIYDMWIDVVHVDPVTGEETNIGTLQAYRENDPNSPQSLKELREEIVRRDELMKNQKVDPEIEALKKKRQEIKNKLREAREKKKQSSSSTSTEEIQSAEQQKADIERRRQEELETTDLYQYDKNFKEFQTYGSTVKEAFDNLFEQVKNNPTDKKLSDLLDYINERLIPEDIRQDSDKNPLVQEYIDGNQKDIEKASKSPKSRISKINAKYDAELAALESKTTTTKPSQDSFDVGSELSTSARKKLNKLGFTDSILSVMSKEDVETAKTFSSKEDSGLKELIDKYNTEDSRTSQVQDLAGNTYSVNESDITTYETESGPIRYITNENGDMVMLSNKDTDRDKQFQKLTEEEKAKTIEEVTKEHRSITALKDLSAKLAHRIGGKVEFENNPNADWKGYNQGMKSVLNEAYMTPDTPFHEILAHPIIKALKYSKKIGGTINLDGTLDKSPAKAEFSKLYQNLLKELETGRGKEIFEQVKRDYQYKEIRIYTIHESEEWGQTYYDIVETGKKLPNLNFERKGLTFKTKNEALKRLEELNPKVKYTLEEQQEEAIVTLLGMMASDKLDAKKDATLISKLKDLWKQISDFVKSLLRQEGVKIDELPITTTLNDLAEIMAYGNNKIILPGYKVEYSTPLGNNYDTLEEVNNEIRGLADANVEVDLSGVDVNEKNKIPNEFNYKFSGTNNYLQIKNENGKWYSAFDSSFNRNDENRKLSWKEIEYKEAKKYYNELFPYEQENRNTLNDFVEKNKEYEQSKEIIEQWKKENNIQYDPEEIYSRGQGFYSSIGAYSNLELDLLLQNLLQHIQDNKKAGGEFTISAFTKPIDKRLKHIEGTGDRVRFVIYPRSEHIKWAAPTDVISGSVWDASEKVSKDKKSELLGVSFTKSPALRNVNEVSPNLADIIDNLSHHHNELGIELTTNNFRIEYDDNIDYSTKKLIDNVNKILDDKYGKLVKPEIKPQQEKKRQAFAVIYNGIEQMRKNTLEEAEDFIKLHASKWNRSENDYTIQNSFFYVGFEGKQPTQTRENTTSIESVKSKLDKENYEKFGGQEAEKGMEFIYPEKHNKKEYTSQALTNLKIAALKEVARKYPRSLITSKVVPIDPNIVGNSEIQYSKISSKQSQKLTQEEEQLKKELSEVNKQLSEAMNKNLVFKTETENKTAEELLKGIDEYNTISPLDKTERKRFLNKLNEEFGEDKVNRIMAIENNFDDIVAQFVSSGINVFTPNEGKFEEC